MVWLWWWLEIAGTILLHKLSCLSSDFNSLNRLLRIASGLSAHWEVHCPRGRINFSLLLITILKLSTSYILGIHKHRSNSCTSTAPLGTTTQKAKDALKS